MPPLISRPLWFNHRSLPALLALLAGLFSATYSGADAQEATSSAAPKIELPALPASFKHPGIMHTKEELAVIRRRIEAGEEPWKSAFEQMKATPWAALDYKPFTGRETISSGFSGSGSWEGGVAHASRDAKSAYTQALMWTLTGDERYVRNAAAILNNWSVLRENRGGNWYLQASWLATMFTNAAEIVRHTWDGWSPAEAAAFSTMLDEAFLPIFHNRPAYGNRLFSVSYAMMAIGVFNDDKAAFTEGLHRWVSYVPAWIYLTGDGPAPIRPDYWLTTPSNEALSALAPGKKWMFREQQVLDVMKANKLGDDSSMFKNAGMLDKGGRHWHGAPDASHVDGLSAETFRDLGHCDLGFAGIVNSAEIAWHQGIDLYSLEQKRLLAFLELHSALRIDEVVPPVFYRVRGTPVQSSVEVAYNHYNHRKGIALPKTLEFIKRTLRPCVSKEINGAPGWSWVPVEPGVRAENIVWPMGCNIAWETLTQTQLP